METMRDLEDLYGPLVISADKTDRLPDLVRYTDTTRACLVSP